MAVSSSKKSTSPSKLTPEQSKVLIRNFSLFDEHNDGTIAIKELGNVFRSLGMNITKEEFDRIVKRLDPNGKGTLTQGTFLLFMAERMGSSDDGERELKTVFNVIDKDASGYITTENLREAMSSLGEKVGDEAMLEMLKIADLSGTGRITFHEFSTAMGSILAARKRR